MNYLFFDTETTGTDTLTARIVQLAAVLKNEKNIEIAKMSTLIRPEGFRIPAPATAIHGITTAKALFEGISLQKALLKFSDLLNVSDHIVAHNLNFDMPILLHEMYRAELPSETIIKLKSLQQTCTMIASTKFCSLPAKYGRKGYKWPKLQELHEILFERRFDGAHNALADVRATARCFFELKKRKVI